jgi:hypothetical protein
MQGQAAYFSGWILTSSTPRTCGIKVSRLAATQQSSGQRTSAFRYLLHTGAVSLAGHKLHDAEPNLLGHVDSPDSCTTAHVEDAGRLPVLRD